MMLVNLCVPMGTVASSIGCSAGLSCRGLSSHTNNLLKSFFHQVLKTKRWKSTQLFNLKRIYYVPYGWQFGVGISSNKAAKKATQSAIFLNFYFQTKSFGWKNPFCCLSKQILRERNPLIEILKEIWQFGKHVINHIFHCYRWTFLPILCEFR